MNTYVTKLVEKRDHLTELATQTAETAATEDRELTEAEEALIAGWQAECMKLDEQLSRSEEVMTSTRAWASLRDRLDASSKEIIPISRNGNANKIEVRGWGDTFTESEQFRSFSGAGRSGSVEMPWGLLEQRAPADPIMTTDLPDNAQFWDGPRRATFRYTLLDTIAREPVSSNAVEWIEWVPAQAAAVAVTPEGQLKPPLDLTPNEKSAMLQTYAVWKAITRQALEDWPRIRAIIEEYLRESLRRSLQNAVAAAITANGQIPTVGAADIPLLQSIRLWMAQVDVNGYAANALLVNPVDAAMMDIAAIAGANVLPGRQNTLWGLVVATDNAIPSGTAYVGDMQAAVTLFDRNRTNLYLTDSHDQNFLRNILVLLAETRAFAVVTAPTAMVKAIGDPTACLDCTDGSIGGASLQKVVAPMVQQPEETTTTTTTTTEQQTIS